MRGITNELAQITAEQEKPGLRLGSTPSTLKSCGGRIIQKKLYSNSKAKKKRGNYLENSSETYPLVQG
jgi:hypothetical protein